MLLLLLLLLLLYQLLAATPNGLKVASALEELVDLRRLCGEDFSYEPHTVNIRTGIVSIRNVINNLNESFN